MLSLGNSKSLDAALTRLFSDPSHTILSYSFASDLSVFSKALPSMSFYLFFGRYIDLRIYYSELYP